MERYLKKCIELFGPSLNGLDRSNSHLYTPQICEIYCKELDNLALQLRGCLSPNEMKMVPYIHVGNSITRILYQISKYGKTFGPKHLNSVLDDVYYIFKTHEKLMVEPGMIVNDDIYYDGGSKILEWKKFKPAYISWETPYETTLFHSEKIDIKKYVLPGDINVVLSPDYEMCVLSSLIPIKDLLILLLSLREWANTCVKH